MALRSSQKILLVAVQFAVRRLLEFGPFRLDPRKRLLLRENDPVSLTPKARWRMLIVLMRITTE